MREFTKYFRQRGLARTPLTHGKSPTYFSRLVPGLVADTATRCLAQAALCCCSRLSSPRLCTTSSILPKGTGSGWLTKPLFLGELLKKKKRSAFVLTSSFVPRISHRPKQKIPSI